MLINGRFVKEDPPKIGCFYVPSAKDDARTNEEKFMQDILLGYKTQQHSLLSKVFGFILRL